MIITFPLSPATGDTFFAANKSWEWTGYSWDAMVAGISTFLMQVVQIEEAATLIQTQNVIAKRQLKGQTA
jgi:hypothetical protein